MQERGYYNNSLEVLKEKESSCLLLRADCVEMGAASFLLHLVGLFATYEMRWVLRVLVFWSVALDWD